MANTSFSYKPTYQLPKLGKIRTEWDLVKHFYTNPFDKKLKNDIDIAEKKYKAFSKRYKSLAFLKSDSSLLASLIDYEALENLNVEKVFIYLFLCKEKNANDTEADKQLNILQQRVTDFTNLITFYGLEVGKLSKERQKKILKNKKFSPYWYLLETLFDSAQYRLSEAEEKILSLKSLTSRSLWISGTEKIISNSVITIGQEEIPLNGALMEVLDSPKKRRHQLWKGIVAAIKKIAPVAENELNALYLDKKISDQLRGYKKPYSATTQSFAISDKSLESLTEVVSGEGYKLSKNFYSYKAKLLGKKKIDYIDRDDFRVRMPALSFEQAVEICRDAFYDFDTLYGEIFDEMLTSGQLDVFPRKGKGGGAFSIDGTNISPLVMLNHGSDYSSLRTLAHEMGHAIHAYRSKKQSALYQGHSVVTAETASTFFEAVVADRLISQLPDTLKAEYINSLIGDKIATMIMCIARYKAELELHETVRSEGFMSWPAMTQVVQKHFQAYCGNSINITEDDVLSFLVKTHYRRNFYQFSYSFGVIASSIMFTRCKQDSAYKKQVDTFLTSGENASVDSIFKSIGINTKGTAAFEEGLKILSEEIKLFKAITKSK